MKISEVVRGATLAALAALLTLGCSSGGRTAADAAERDAVARDAYEPDIDRGQHADAGPVDVGEIAGATYYVATTGDDGDPGSFEAPWRTVQYAVESVGPGDVVLIRGGIYHESVVSAVAGEEAAPIVIAAYPGEHPLLDGAGVDATNGVVLTHDYVHLRGLEIAHWEGNAIWVERAAGFVIEDVEMYEVFYGLGIADGAHDFEIRRTTAHHFDLYGFDVSPSGGAPCHDGRFVDCVAHTGRDPEQNVDGFALGHGDQEGFTLEGCETYGVYDGFDISARRTQLDRCSAHHCGNGGFKLWQDEIVVTNSLSYANTVTNVELDWDEEPGTVTLQNCTFFGSETFDVWVENNGDTLHMHNCILAGGEGLALVFEQPGTIHYDGDYNLFQHAPERAFVIGYESELGTSELAAWTNLTGQDRHSLTAATPDEIFTDPDGPDLHLATGSPAHDHGDASDAPDHDYEGRDRPQGGSCDIGAYED